MLRADALQAIYPELEDRIVVTIMGAVAAELHKLGHRPNFFYLEHAMGLASSMGLGIALSMPDHQVIVLRSEEHTSELQSLAYLVCRLLLEKKKSRACPKREHLRLGKHACSHAP